MVISQFIYALTKLNIKHMSPIKGLNVHNLIFMAVVQWPILLGLDGEMKDRDTCFHERYEFRRISSFLCNNICAPETVLRATATGDENRAVVDCNG
jgi:hypothetical protein